MFIKSLHIIIEIHLYIMMPIGINEIEFIIVNDIDFINFRNLHKTSE